MYSRLLKLAEMFAPIGYFLLRVSIGYVFMRTGYGKWMHLENTINYFRTLGIPLAQVQAPLVATIELLGGLALMVGFYARPAAILLSGVMVVAIVTAIWPGEPNKLEVFTGTEMLYLFCLIMFAGRGSENWALKPGA